MIKAEDEDIVFGISPQGNMDNNYNNQFIDVKEWLTEDGYIDYIVHRFILDSRTAACHYEETVMKHGDLIQNDVKLYVGLAPYKIGLEDTFAGNGKWEWANNDDLLARMVETAREEDHYQGFLLFRYDSVFKPQSDVKSDVKQELENLKDVL